MSFEDIVREFCEDVLTAYGSQGQSFEEILDTLSKDWPDLAETFRKASDALEHVNRAKAIEKKIRTPISDEVLDDAVHEHFSHRASAVNNSGLTAQIETLLAAGWSEEDVLAAYKEEDEPDTSDIPEADEAWFKKARLVTPEAMLARQKREKGDG